MDGSNIAQLAVPPGGSFKYEFDLLDASTFWYHPHIRSNEQVEKGLYGALVVHDRAEDQSLGLPDREHVLILDDILLDEQGQIEEPFPSDPVENAIMHVNGREGNTLLVNGRASPTRYIKRGVPHRLRIVNTANASFMRVSIPGHTMWRIGGDGGLLEAPIAIPPVGMVPDPEEPGEMISNPDPSRGLLLTPGERADVVFTPAGEGPVEIEWHDYPRGRHTATQNPDGTISLGHAHHDGHKPPRTLMTLNLYGWGSGVEYVPPSALRDIEPIDVTGAETIAAEFGHTQPTPEGEVTFFVQRKENTGQCPLPAGVPCPLPFDAVTPADAPMVSVGDTRIIEINNLTGGDHNFHLHGFFFQHLETEFVDMDNPQNNYTVPASHLEVKDTIHLPRRPGAMMRSKSITRVAVEFDDTGREGLAEAFGKAPTSDTSGGWVFHCHLLEHVDNGMMSFVQVAND